MTLLDGRVLSGEQLGRADRVVEMGKMLAVPRKDDAVETAEGRGGKAEEMITFESDRVIEAKLRRLYTLLVLKKAFLRLRYDVPLGNREVQLHNVRAPNAGTVARCSVLGSWGELVAGGVEVFAKGLEREMVWLGAQAYEEDFLIGLAVATGNGGVGWASYADQEEIDSSRQLVEPQVRYRRVELGEVMALSTSSL